ncbi:rifin PIR protein,putative [Plasmodium sp. DRC-Itaito]|nr:rifin PIR protein,putative [Plasmodium sp. DRC-Itaito]
MKSVIQQFDDRTSQRFEEYEERMKDKRQKRKEERDKNIQKIIEKDKMEKTLEEKIEKVCLKCGVCGIEVGIATVVSELKDVASRILSININISEMINAENYRSAQSLTTSIYEEIQNVCEGNMAQEQVCNGLRPSNNPFWFKSDILEATRKGIDAAKDAETAAITANNATSTQLYSAIGYSVLAILIIVLVMVIIYLFLRNYLFIFALSTKKKMNKKCQYTKLLNQ